MKEAVFDQVKADLVANEAYLRNHEHRFHLSVGLGEWRAHPNKLRNFGKILVNPIRNLPPFRDSLFVVAEKAAGQ